MSFDVSHLSLGQAEDSHDEDVLHFKAIIIDQTEEPSAAAAFNPSSGLQETSMSRNSSNLYHGLDSESSHEPNTHSFSEYLQSIQSDRSLMSVAVEMMLWHQKAHEIALKWVHDFYQNATPLSEAIWRTLILDRTLDLESADPEYGTCYERYMWGQNDFLRNLLRSGDAVAELIDGLSEGELLAWREMEEVQLLLQSFGGVALWKRFAVTSDGWFGVVPPLTGAGGVVYVTQAAQVPFVLRKVDENRATEHSGDRLSWWGRHPWHHGWTSA